MKKVKLQFSKLSVPEKIQKAKTVVIKMTGNTTFTTPSPSLASITTAATKLEGSYDAALDGGISKKTAMRADETALDTLMSLLSAYVQDVSGGDEQKIQSSGMSVKSAPTAPQSLEAPMALRANSRTNSGEANLVWNTVKGAKSYYIQSTATPNDSTSWIGLDVCTKSRLTVGELPSMSMMWFRVAAVGPKGKSQWSDPAKAVIA